MNKYYYYYIIIIILSNFVKTYHKDIYPSGLHMVQYINPFIFTVVTNITGQKTWFP